MTWIPEVVLLIETSRGYRDHSSTGRAVRRIENGTLKLPATAEKLERQLLAP